jgi:hypothetical protein
MRSAFDMNRYSGLAEGQSVQYTMQIIDPVCGTNHFSFARGAAVTPRRHVGRPKNVDRCHLRSVAHTSKYENQVQSMVEVVHESL